jgi:hypothetical protein
VSWQRWNSWVSCLSPSHAFHENEVVNFLLIEVALSACPRLNEALVYTPTEAISSRPRADVLVKAAAHKMDVS